MPVENDRKGYTGGCGQFWCSVATCTSCKARVFAADAGDCTCAQLAGLISNHACNCFVVSMWMLSCAACHTMRCNCWSTNFGICINLDATIMLTLTLASLENWHVLHLAMHMQCNARSASTWPADFVKQSGLFDKAGPALPQVGAEALLCSGQWEQHRAAAAGAHHYERKKVQKQRKRQVGLCFGGAQVDIVNASCSFSWYCKDITTPSCTSTAWHAMDPINIISETAARARKALCGKLQDSIWVLCHHSVCF